MTHDPSTHGSSGSAGVVDKLDFDANRKQSAAGGGRDGSNRPDGDGDDDRPGSAMGLLRDDNSLLSDVVTGIVQEDRNKFQRRIAQVLSFTSAMMCCLCAGSMVAFSLYGPLFIKRLHYTQYEVNAISVTLEMASYFFVPVVGFLTDRFSPRPIVFSSAILFGFGYFLAAYVYHRGPKNEGGLPSGVMQLAFVPIGMGTGAMYLSSLTATVKNFGRGRFKGLALSVPSAAFGLSAVWQSQIGSRYLREPPVNGIRGEVDVYRYFLFLGGTLAGVGLFASLTMRIVDEDGLIDLGVAELERSGYLDRSGILERSSLLQRSIVREGEGEGYGTVSSRPQSRRQRSTHSTLNDDDNEDAMSEESHDSHFEKIKKLLLLNAETRRFLSDPTMWMLAMAFFLVTGPIETYINNVGTIIGTTYPPGVEISPANDSANHVSILAITSTVARLVSGALTDLLSPQQEDIESEYDEYDESQAAIDSRKPRFTVSRVTMMLWFNLLLIIGLFVLATPLPFSNQELLLPVSAAMGIGNGANFALEPVIISVVWGVQNFGTNFGIIAMTPAIGALIWSAIYSVVYDNASGPDGLCHGWQCYGPAAVGWLVCSILSCGFWLYAWKGKGGWARRGLAV